MQHTIFIDIYASIITGFLAKIENNSELSKVMTYIPPEMLHRNDKEIGALHTMAFTTPK